MDETIDLNAVPATPPCTPPAEPMVLPAATPPFTPTMEAPRSTWRKKSSQKGKPRFRLARHWRINKPKPSPLSSKKDTVAASSSKKKETSAASKKKREAADHVGEKRPPVRRKLDLDGEPKSSKTSTPLGSFSRAMLMDSLRALAKLDLGNYSRAQLMDNLRSLANNNSNNLLPLAVADTVVPTADEQDSKRKRKKKMIRASQLKLVPYTVKQAAAARAAEDPFIHMALAPRGCGSSGLMYSPRWVNVAIELPDAKTLRELVLTTPAIESAYRELMKMEETCLGEDLGDMPESPELKAERQRLEALVDEFMVPVREIIGKREFSNWKGSVVTSVVGTFLTQNVHDMLSSNVFMNLAAKFPFMKNKSNMAENTDVTLDGNGLGESKPSDKAVDELIASLRTGEISNWNNDLIMKVLQGKFEESTASKNFEDIKSFVKKDTSHWKYLPEEAYKNGYQKEEINETIDWEALLHAPFADIEECIRDRGTQSQLVFRILLFLIRIKRDHGSINLEWLRYIPRAKAKEYLFSIIGLGYKSVDCIRLLSLRHRAFPVDTNVAHIVTRLGWVPLKPLDNSLEFYMVNTYPFMDAIQRYLGPLLCNIPTHKLYELHCQQITFGKSICTKYQPNCGACPFTTGCKYYKSLIQRLELPEHNQHDARGQTNMDRRIHCDLLVTPSHEHMHQYHIEMGKDTERHSTEPIIEMPLTPLHEYPESSKEEKFLEATSDDEYVYHDYIGDIEDIDPHYDEEIDLRIIKPTENATTKLSHGTNMVLIHPQANSIPMIMTYRLRTERLAYIIPDGHEILDKFEPRVPGDCNPYLFIIRDHDAHIVNATILIPCRTANRGIFPLDGTYFQKNEVFADHSSTSSPIQLKREVVCYFEQCKVYFGTSIHTVTKGQTHAGIKEFYHSGYMCTREFNRSTRRPGALSAELHATRAHKETGKKRGMTESSPGSGGM